MQNVFLKLINLFRSKENSNKPDTIGNIALDQNKQDLDNLKYLFPEKDIDFKNFGKNELNYSTIVHHHENFLKSIKNFLKNEDLEKTKNFLNTINNFYNETTKFYLDLFSFDKIFMESLNKIVSKDTNTLISFTIWGKKYSERFSILALNSLENEIIELYKKYKIQIILFIDETANNILINKDNFKTLEQMGIIKTIIIPSKIFQLKYFLDRISIARYFVFGFIQNICWRFCAEKNINLSLLTPDNFYSKGFLSSLVERVNEKEDLFAIFSNSSLKVQVSNFDTINELTKELKKMNLNQLFDFFKQNIHHSFYDYFIFNNKKIESNSPMYILNNQKELCIYSLHSHPYIISNKYLNKFKNFQTFLPIDESFPTLNNFDTKYFEKNLDLKSGICLDFAEFENFNKQVSDFSEKHILENFGRFKNNKLRMWLLKNPVKLEHKENSKIVFNILNDNEKSKKNYDAELTDNLNPSFEKIIKEI